MKKATLYLVATPIGNLGDMTPRAIEVLQSVDRILCEDTRHSSKLLHHFAIERPLVALHEHNEKQKISKILTWLEKGESLALISDAGTPTISDPGMPLVREVRNKAFAVIPMPGACALIAALAVSGLPTDRFTFVGFLPAKTKAKHDQLTALQKHRQTLVFYESKHRMQSTLVAMKEIFGKTRQIFIAREMTKTFEEYFFGTLEDALVWFGENDGHQKGEFVLIVHGARVMQQKNGELILDQAELLKALMPYFPPKKLAAIVSELGNTSKKELYQHILSLKAP